VVTKPPDDRTRVFFGAWVRIEDEEGHETELRIVGPTRSIRRDTT